MYYVAATNPIDLHFSKIHFPGAEKQVVSRPVRALNKLLTKLGSPIWLVHRMDYREDMLSLEQAVNFQHLIARVAEAHVSGAFVELGCYTGSTTAVIGSVLRELEEQREFHVYDSFSHSLGKNGRDVLAAFVDTMKREKLDLPQIHKGDLFQTVPAELPAQIAFAHIDLGVGGDPQAHKKIMLHCIRSVYDRMAHGGICILMDFHIEGVTLHGANTNPGVKLACDEFFKDKPEKVYTLYGGAYSHGYFRKA